MKRNGIIAAAAVLALGTVAMATDASAQSRHRGMGASVQGTGMTSTRGNLSGNAGFNRRATLNRGTRFSSGYARTGYSKGYARTGFTRTSWSGRPWQHHRRFGGWGWGPSVGIGFADYGWGGPGFGYGYAPGLAYAGYGGCGCGAPAYAYGYGPGWGYGWGPSIGIGFRFGGWGWGGHRFHRF